MGPVDVVILGIDPGTANTGYGVVARRGGRLVALDGGVVETSSRAPLSARLAEIICTATFIGAILWLML